MEKIIITRLLCLVSLLFAISSLQSNYFVQANPQVPCYFIFGDSLSDNGNNNNLKTLAKVNYKPYGIDFPGGPTGRFSNGKTSVDVIAELLGFDALIPPFATAKQSDVTKGVNYASGSSGIRDETGNQLGMHVSLDNQIKNFQVTLGQISSNIGSPASEYVKKCLFTVGMGSNDFINNYFVPTYYNTSKQYTLQQYAEVLSTQYSKQLSSLYNLGARKIALIGVGPIGCTPNAINVHGGGKCSGHFNVGAQLFNSKLKALVNNLNKQFPDAKFIFVNMFAIATSINGFPNTNTGCCPMVQWSLCDPTKAPCQDRTKFAFWDGFHPTEAFNRITAGRSYKASSPADAYPYDISRLVAQ